MFDETLLDHLLSLWQQEAEQGRDLRPAELCRDHPELLPELERRVEAVRKIGDLARTGSAASAPTVPDGRGFAGPDLKLPFLTPPQAADELGRLGGFRVLRILGAGGMGLVLEAEDPLMLRRVALKVMRPEVAVQAQARQRFLREARSAGRLSHDHIITIHHVGEDNGVPFLVMPLLQGEPLAQRLRREGRFPLDEVVRIGREMAEGLAAAHAAGLIHRDVKPANVWLEAPGGRVKLLDFGLARLAEMDEQLTPSGGVVGTPAYMAPEQASGQVEARTDVFSLGVVLYQMTAGRRPFPGPDLVSIVAQWLQHDPLPLGRIRPEVPAPLSELVQRMLARTPGQRPAARAVAQSLRLLTPSPSPASASTTLQATVPIPLARGAEPALPPRGSRRTVPALLVALLALVVLAAVPLLWPKPQPGTNDNREAPAKDGAAQEGGPKEVPANDPEPPQAFENAIGMRLKLIPRGRFLQGSPAEEEQRSEDEGPQHEVVITRPFYLGVYPVTQEEYRRVMGRNPSHFCAEDGGKETVTGLSTERFPVEMVSWEDAVVFCEQLSALPQEKAAGRVYRLPTEAEWEYACRAGTTTAFWWGDPATSRQGNFWVLVGPVLHRTCQVGSYPPNPWGLHDMHGNVCQWCQDWYDKDYYGLAVSQDPPGPEKGSERVVRGGYWSKPANNCRAASRGSLAPNYRFFGGGFRVALSLPRK
jgi:formylglycine-generating enzyme required for sulfatase activity